LLLFFSSLCAFGKPIELSDVINDQLINNHLDILQSADSDLSLQGAIQHYNQGKFSKNIDGKVSFGFTHEVLWASVVFDNASGSEVRRVFYLDSAWLDHADFYFIHQETVIDTALLGDTLIFSHRENNIRMLSKVHAFKPGITQVLMRFESKDPLLIPLYLTTEEAIGHYLKDLSYFYGFIYGAFFILFVYNIVLSISLKDKRYIYYSLYLLSFLALNIAYTGHGFQFIWPNNLFLQQWLMIIFLYCYIIFGIAFCFEFLRLKTFTPNIYKLRLGIYTGLVLLMMTLLLSSEQLLAVKIGVAQTSLLVVIFLSLGFVALKKGHEAVKFFIPAVFLGAGGAAISAGTTWGVIPYNTVLFHGIEVGMLFEMSILALVLAFSLNEVNKARITAEVTAQIDYLTELYNRRAFITAVNPLWELAIRQQHTFSMILIDIDWFKKINDVFGHGAGDAALKSIAATLKQQIRQGDILARWGGEEFIIFLPSTNKVTAIQLANRLRQKIQEMTVLHDEGKLSITASFGVAEYNEQMRDLEELIKQADIAMYNAKKSGRNTVCEIQENHSFNR
jgi:diguanylate cyclase (GGDEF)-like protein